MDLQTLLADITPVGEAPSDHLEITAITDDSRQVTPDGLFVAVPGLNVDGHHFIPQAVEAGASVIVGERPRAELDLPAALPYIRVADAREALGRLHAAWHDHPARKLTLIGVTGTDGKTTTTTLIYEILRAAGIPVGMISTVDARIGGQTLDTGLHTTTPPAEAVQRYLAQMVDAGMTHAVLETTSHGLAQRRLAGCRFDVAVITNITHEHLDYHGSWEAYRDAKAMLFGELLDDRRLGLAVLNRDDPGSYDYLAARAGDPQIAYSVHPELVVHAKGKPGIDSSRDLTAKNIHATPSGTRFTLCTPGGEIEISSSLIGDYNVSNILAAAATAWGMELPLSAIAEGVAAVRGVPGRMECIDAGQDFLAIVDFAHTPNALRRALETGQALAGDAGRVIVVFGSAGLRDKEKRRLMGEVAGQLADLTVVTAEDPRTEPLAEILAESAAGLQVHGRREGVDYWRVPDRGAAIRYAVQLARPGDVVMTCGKGHEQSMCFGAVEYPWDDREAMRRALHGETLDTLPTS